MTALKTYLKTSKKFKRCHKQRDSRLQVTDGVNLKTTVPWGVWIFSSKTQTEIIGDFLHLSLSTRRPAHSVERAVLTDNTRILPIASLQCKKQWRISWDHSYAIESNIGLARYKCTCNYNHITKNEIEINNISTQVIIILTNTGTLHI